MVQKTKTLLRQFTATIFRVLFIFLVLCISVDSITRLTYSYMPITFWMDFQSVHAEMLNGEAVVKITRKPNRLAISTFHRTLLVRYPDERRLCTASTITITEDPSVQTIIIPMRRMLSDNCAISLGVFPVDAILQVSYIFDFPFGVKRLAVRYSNRFSLGYDGEYKIGPPRFRDTSEIAN